MFRDLTIPQAIGARLNGIAALVPFLVRETKVRRRRAVLGSPLSLLGRNEKSAMGSFILFLFTIIALAAAVGWYRAREDEFGEPMPSIVGYAAKFVVARGGLGIPPRILGWLNLLPRQDRSGPAVKP